MKINSLRIKNFRGYEEETTIDFNDLTVLVGKNDTGKSTILEALNIFFNEGKDRLKLTKMMSMFLVEKMEILKQ